MTAFQPNLKALTYFQDGDLPTLSQTIQEFLAEKAAAVTDIPVVARLSDLIAPG